MFKCSVQYGYDEMMALYYVLEKTKRKPSIKFTRYTLYLAGGLVLLSGVVTIPTMELSFNAFIPLLVGVGLIFMGKKYVHFTVKNSLKNISRSLGNMNFSLEKKNYEVTDRSRRVELQYQDLADIVYYNNMWFLFRNKTRSYILPEKNFYEGDVSELADFLKLKTGITPTILK